MREIVLDTETTGLDPKQGHKIVEIGCIELHNLVPTGRVFHQYINPMRDMPLEAFQVHGLSSDFLSTYPLFQDIAQAFLDFIQESPLVIHNARFDLRFLNFELQNLKLEHHLNNNEIIDTLMLARERFPGSPASLDALCRRFNIDNSGRLKHGALLDSELLAEVYLELCGGRQPGLNLMKNQDPGTQQEENIVLEPHPSRPYVVSDIERERHQALIKKLSSPAVWDLYRP